MLDAKWNVTPLLGDFGGRAGFYIILQNPTLPRISGLSFVVGSCSLFFHFNSVLACLQAQGLARGTAMGAGTWVKCKKENNSLQIMLFELSLLIKSNEGTKILFP